jgi:endonuclease/exonuclease/phosphatase family metal-dependent hydrolase
VPSTLRLATFNLENLDDTPPSNTVPSLDDRIALMRPQLLRLNADVLCLQEVNSQELPNQPPALTALDRLLDQTPYSTFNRVTSVGANGQLANERNIVVLSRFPIVDHQQHLHDLVDGPLYQIVTQDPPAAGPIAITWERPALHARIDLGGSILNVIVVHLKSKLPTDINGQKLDQFTWKSASGWAEGFFLSSLKRMGQALEVRRLVDLLFDAEPGALIAVCGDFNAEADEVPIEALVGEVENTGNPELSGRVLVPCERSVPESARYSLYHRGRGTMLDHVLVSRSLLAGYRGTEIHNETLHDESVAFATDRLYPESDHAPVVATFTFGA